MELESFRVRPTSATPRQSLPLTAFDILWFRFFPVERLFFYAIPDLSSDHFHRVVVPRLKHSLSLTLDHFYPLAGRVAWPSGEPRPLILCEPNDSVSFRVVESKEPDSFLVFSGKTPHSVAAASYLVSELDTSKSEAAAISLQVTIFVGQGLALGISAHHAVLDGKSSTMFLKAWAHINNKLYAGKEVERSLPVELTPLIGLRDNVDEPYDEVLKIANQVGSVITSVPMPDVNPEVVSGTVSFTRRDAEKLREIVLTELGESRHLSTFVLALAYSLTCLAKAKSQERIAYCFVADYRTKLNLASSENYFGNCVHAAIESFGAETEIVGALVKKVSEMVEYLKESSYADTTKRFMETLSECGEIPVGVAGSPRFGVYKIDFGWGRPVKVEVPSIYRTGAISMADDRDGDGGIEIGIVLPPDQMKSFIFYFLNFLN